jgi:hypothetical protein
LKKRLIILPPRGQTFRGGKISVIFNRALEEKSKIAKSFAAESTLGKINYFGNADNLSPAWGSKFVLHVNPPGGVLSSLTERINLQCEKLYSSRLTEANKPENVKT